MISRISVRMILCLSRTSVAGGGQRRESIGPPFRGKLAVARRLLQGSELFLQPVNGALFLEALAMCTTR